VWNKTTDILRLLMKGAWLPTLRYEVEYPGLLLYGNDGTLERFNTAAGLLLEAEHSIL